MARWGGTLQENRPHLRWSPLFYVEVQASLSERGSFGHLGAYDRQIVPARFVVCRHATAAEDKALFQDGSFAY